MARKRPTQAQQRRRYAAAGWLGTGLLVILLGVGVYWALSGQGGGPSESGSSGVPLSRHQAPDPKAPTGGEEADPDLLERGPRAAVIIDDLGHDRSAARRLSALPYPVAMAVLPDAPYTEEAAKQANAHGKEVLAHVPMEPRDDAIAMDGRFLRVGMDRSRFLKTLHEDLTAIPYAEGVNNHMGSALTARGRAMGWVMEGLRHEGLFFVDSRTTGDTRALDRARRAGIPAAGRDIFLDNNRDKDAIRAQFRKLLAEAREKGTAIGIGHPYPETLTVLEEVLDEASGQGVEIVPVREIIAVRDRRKDEKPRPLAYQADN